MSLQPVQTIEEIRRIVSHWKEQHNRVGVVPTMGNLHEGHLELVREACRSCDKVVATVFVNPLQFGEGEDFADYPRDLDTDGRLLEQVGVDALFAPTVGTMYPRPRGETTQVVVPRLSSVLCGAYRPVHFSGVTTVVNKLFNIVQPDVAVFGEKDFQQLTIIRRMTRDLALPVEIVGVPTVRESDGLAMSSRNNYLTHEERKIAPRLQATLREVVAQMRADGGPSITSGEQEALATLRNIGFRPDYVSVRRRSDLAEPGDDDHELVILAAAWLGKARLIDNLQFTL